MKLLLRLLLSLLELATEEVDKLHRDGLSEVWLCVCLESGNASRSKAQRSVYTYESEMVQVLRLWVILRDQSRLRKAERILAAFRVLVTDVRT